MIRSIVLSGRILSGGGSLNLSQASPLNFSLNFGLLRIRFSTLHFFLSGRLTYFFVFFMCLLDLGGLGGGGEVV